MKTPNPMPPENEKPKKKRGKGPWILGGLSAAAIGSYLALAPNTEPTEEERNATRAKITQTVPPDAGARIAALKKLAERNAQSHEEINLENAPRLMRQGNFEAAKLLYDEIWKKFRGVDPWSTPEDLYASAYASLSITTDESEIIMSAIGIKRYLHDLEDDGANDYWDINKIFSELIGSFEDQANDPFNPLLLKLIGMDEQQLRDKVTELVLYFDENGWPLTIGIEGREKIISAYQIQL